MCRVLSIYVGFIHTFLCLIQLEKALTYEKLMEWTKPSMMHQQEV